MRGVTYERDAVFRRQPGRKRVTEDELPVYKAVFRRCADDGVADWGPVRDGFYGFFDVAGRRPAFFYIGFVLLRSVSGLL